MRATPGAISAPFKQPPTGNKGRIDDTTIMETTRFNASELCSRKLWQLVTNREADEVNDIELQAAINELATRRHYLAELREIGKLKGQKPGA